MASIVSRVFGLKKLCCLSASRRVPVRDITSRRSAAGSEGEAAARGSYQLCGLARPGAPISAESAAALPVCRFPDTTRSCVNERWFVGLRG